MRKNKITRRDFLKIIGLIPVGLTLSACGVDEIRLSDTTATPPFLNPEVVIGSIQLTREERAFLDKLGVLQVLVDDNFSPITYYDVEEKKFGGIGVEALQILAEMLKFEYHIIRDEALSWADRLDKIKRNEIDILAGASRNPSREEYGVFTTHEYFMVNYALIKAIDTPQVYVASMDDIKNYRVGLSEGGARNDFILEFITDPTKISYYPTKELAFDALKRHEIDLYPFNEAVFKEEFFGGKLFDFEVAYSIKEQTSHYAFFCPKTDTGTRLAALLDKGMEHIQIDKLIAQRYQNRSSFDIYKEYLENLRRQNDLARTRLTLLGAGAALSLGVTATIAISNRRLKTEILKRTQAEEKIHQLNLNLEQLAMTDELTQLTNRRAFFNRADEELRRSSRYQHPLSFMMIDIDHFKNINDTYGHDAGDEALRSVAKMLTNNIRDIDLLARFGGEEFVVMMPETDLTNAVELAERLRLSVESTPCLIKEIETRFTVSIGVASMHKDIQDINLLIKDADTAMYKAKEQGRNRVVYFESQVKYDELSIFS